MFSAHKTTNEIMIKQHKHKQQKMDDTMADIYKFMDEEPRISLVGYGRCFLKRWVLRPFVKALNIKLEGKGAENSKRWGH